MMPTAISDRELRELVARAVVEKERRIKESGISYYQPQAPPHNDQSFFHKCMKRIRAIFGGNRSGKSVSGATEATWYATGTHPYKRIAVPNFGRIVCTDFTNGIEKVIIPEMKKWLPKDAIRPGKEGYNVESRTLFLKNGSTIEFMSYDQDVEKFASASRHWVWFDEEPPQEIFKQCQMRLLDTKGDIWITMTPERGMTWVYSDIYEQYKVDPIIEVFHFDTRRNPYVDPEVLADLMRGRSEAELDICLGGKFVSLSGLVYKEFNEGRHTIPRFSIPSSWPRVCAIDPHPRNPTVVLYLALAPTDQFTSKCREAGITLDHDISDSEVYIVYDEVYPSESKLISEICKIMKAKEGNDHIRFRLIDSSANTPDPIIGRTVKEEFEQYNIRTVLADKNNPNKIYSTREKLQRNALYFFKDVHNAIWEIRHYVWDDYHIRKEHKDPKEKPRKKRDHAMDCLGYICAASPRYEAPRVYRPPRSTVDPMTGY